MEIILEKFSEENRADYFRLVTNAAVMQMISGRAYDAQEADTAFKRVVDNNHLDSRFGSFRMLSKKTKEFLGFCKLEIKTKGSREAELGYMLLPEYWGKGIASVAVQQLLDTAKRERLIDSVFAIIDPENIASRNILMKYGFKSLEFKDFDGLPGELLGLKL